MTITSSLGWSGDTIEDFVAASAVAVLRLATVRAAATLGDADAASLAAAIENLAVWDVAGDPVGFVEAVGTVWSDLASAGDPSTLFGLIEAQVETVTSDASPMAAAEQAFIGAALAVAALGITFVASNDAAAIRIRLSTAAEVGVAAAYLVSLATGEWLRSVVFTAVAALSDETASLSPLVRVETARSLPAPLLAWKLYGSLDRVDDLVARNACATALIMPMQIVALAPES